MDRREFLHAIAGGTTAATAGCLDSGMIGGSDATASPGAVEELVFEKVNEKRALREMEPYEENERAAERARKHAEDMAENDYYDHTSLDGETQGERYSFCGGGENIHKTFFDRGFFLDGEVQRYTTDEELADGLVEAWMNSDPHRERGIYGEWWESAGVGVSITDDGTVYAVMGFCQ